MSKNSTKTEKKILKLYHKVKEWAFPNNNLENFKRDWLPKRKNNKKLKKKKKNKLKNKRRRSKIKSKIKVTKREKIKKKPHNSPKSI